MGLLCCLRYLKTLARFVLLRLTLDNVTDGLTRFGAIFKTFFPTTVHCMGSLFCINWIRTALSIRNIIRQFFKYIQDFVSSRWCNCVASYKISVGPEIPPQKWHLIDFCSVCNSCTSKASVFSSILLCVCEKKTHSKNAADHIHNTVSCSSKSKV